DQGSKEHARPAEIAWLVCGLLNAATNMVQITPDDHKTGIWKSTAEAGKRIKISRRFASPNGRALFFLCKLDIHLAGCGPQIGNVRRQLAGIYFVSRGRTVPRIPF